MNIINRMKKKGNISKRHLQILGAILIASALVRMAAAVYLGDQVVNLPGTADQVSYHTLALRVLAGHGFSFGEAWWPATAANAPTAHWSFLYTFYLVFIYLIFGPHPLAARLIQAALVGILQPLLVYAIGSKIFNRTVGLVSAVVAAFYVYFVYYAATLMTESFYITAILGSFYLAMLLADGDIEHPKFASRDLLLGLALGLTLAAAILLRQVYVLFIPFLFAWVIWERRKIQIKNSILALMLTTFIIVAIIAPFTIYNTIRFGHFVLLNTNAGFAFFWSNNPIYGTHFVPLLPQGMGGYHALIPPELLSLDEAALDQALLQRGLQFVLDNPVRYILLSLSRIPVYFMFWPSKNSELISNISRVASFGLFLPFMLYGIIRSFTAQSSSPDKKLSYLVLLLMFMIVYSAIHILSWALIRYRLPVDAVLIIFAGLALADLGERVFYRWFPKHRRALRQSLEGERGG